jgi:hypothetical protein
MRSRKFWERRYGMETIRLILIVCILLDAPAALTFEVVPAALEIALVAGAFMTLLIELIQDY